MPVTPLSRGRRSAGQSLAEFALILPIFAMLSIGVLDATRVFAAQVAVTNAAREGAIFASRGGNYLIWCRDPGDPEAADPFVGAPVDCPGGTGSTNYGGDPANVAYRVAAQTLGLDHARVTLDPPRCGTGSTAPAATCVAGPTPRYVLVKVTYQFDMLTPVIGQLWGQSISISSTATARVSDQ
jgi:Flp pilus assembly protein TadG